MVGSIAQPSLTFAASLALSCTPHQQRDPTRGVADWAAPFYRHFRLEIADSHSLLTTAGGVLQSPRYMCRSVMGLVRRGGCETLPSCSPGDNVAVDWTPGQRHMLPVCVRMCFVPPLQHLSLKGARGNIGNLGGCSYEMLLLGMRSPNSSRPAIPCQRSCRIMNPFVSFFGRTPLRNPYLACPAIVHCHSEIPSYHGDPQL